MMIFFIFVGVDGFLFCFLCVCACFPPFCCVFVYEFDIKSFYFNSENAILTDITSSSNTYIIGQASKRQVERKRHESIACACWFCE